MGFADFSRVLIGRCAWHPHYYGRSLWSGVASWRGWAIRFTDGICPRCLERFRHDHREALTPRPSERDPSRTTTAA